MEIVTISVDNPESSCIKRAVSVLRKGGVVMHPTDTCYGLAVDPFQKKALEKLYFLKGMEFSKPITLLVSDIDAAQSIGCFEKEALLLAQKEWPGAFTLVVPIRESVLSEFFFKNSHTVGLRVPDHALSLDLLRQYRGPLTSTSANFSGQPPCYDVQQFFAQMQAFGKETLLPDFVLDAGRIPQKPPSRVVRVIHGRVEVLR